MRERGVVVAVDTIPVGDELAAAASASATSLTLTDTADFYEPEVDQTITIGSETIVYTAADPDTDIITLATPLANAYSIGEEVLLGGHTVVAQVNVTSTSSDPYYCIVPSAIIEQLNGNVYDAVGKSVVVEEDSESGDLMVLWMDDELPTVGGEFLELPRLRLIKGTVSTNNNADQSVGWDSADIDTESMWDSGDPQVIRPNRTGLYLVTIHGVWGSNATGRRAMMFEVSPDNSAWSTVTNGQDRRIAVGGGDVTTNEISQVFTLQSDNYYRVRRNQDSGGALNLTNSRISLVFFGST